jgi:hypothetical protein
MTIRFAAANPEYNPVISRLMSAPVRLRAANDNVLGICSDKLLKAALHHFAEHGLGAANHARLVAERAFRTGRDDDGRWWLSICRALDRRMADAAAKQLGIAPAEPRETARKRPVLRDH